MDIDGPLAFNGRIDSDGRTVHDATGALPQMGLLELPKPEAVVFFYHLAKLGWVHLFFCGEDEDPSHLLWGIITKPLYMYKDPDFVYKQDSSWKSWQP